MGGERNVVGGGFLEVSHRSSALPARRANVFVEGSQSVQHGGGESRLRDGYRQASRGCRIERGSFSLPSSHLSFCTILYCLEIILSLFFFPAEESDRGRQRWNLAHALRISHRRIHVEHRQERNGHGEQECQHDELYCLR